MLILPNLEPYLHLLEPEMQLEKQKNEVKRHEAWQVYGALLVSSNTKDYLVFNGHRSGPFLMNISSYLLKS